LVFYLRNLRLSAHICDKKIVIESKIFNGLTALAVAIKLKMVGDIAKTHSP